MVHKIFREKQETQKSQWKGTTTKEESDIEIFYLTAQSQTEKSGYKVIWRND